MRRDFEEAPVLELSVFVGLAGLLLLLYAGSLLGYSAKISARIRHLNEKAALDSSEKGELQYYRLETLLTRIGWVAPAAGAALFAFSFAFR